MATLFWTLVFLAMGYAGVHIVVYLLRGLWSFLTTGTWDKEVRRR
jgi:hypothetical protein